MTDTDRDDAHPDSLPRADTAPASEPLQAPDNGRSDIEQAVSARADAVARGEGGVEADMNDGTGGTGGVVKNQDENAQ
jgi:hypothetical protein